MPETRFFDHALDLLAVGGFDGKLWRINPAWTNTLGWTEEELLARPFGELIHPDDLVENLEDISKMATGGDVLHYETRLLCRDGSYRWVIASVHGDREAGEIFIVAKDVHERHLAETRAREMEADLRFRVGLEDIVTAMSTRFLGAHEHELPGEVEAALSALCGYHQLDRAYVLKGGNGAIELFVEWWSDEVERVNTPIPSLPIEAQRFWVRVLRASEPVHVADVTGALPDGSEAAMQVLAQDGVKSILFVPLRARDETVGFMGFEARRQPCSWSDESVALMRTVGELFVGSVERCRAETAVGQAAIELEERNAELERSNRELENFASIVSHDLKSPLQVVRGFVELLGSQVEDTDAQTYVAAALRGAARMDTLIDDLLAYSRAGHRPAELVAVDLDTTFAEVLADSASIIRETEAIITSAPLPTVQGEPTQLRQLFQNLITNAIKFRRTGVTPEVHVSAAGKGSLWEFTVADNGIGVAPENRVEIFGMFSRVHHGDRPGSGIGLAICSRVVDNYGGTIWAEGNEPEGSRFVFTLRKDA